MNKKRALLPLVIVAGGALIAMLILSSRRTVERQENVVPPPLVRVQTVELREVALVVRGHGSASPVIDTTLAAQVSGRIATVSSNFAEGAAFRRGDVLLEIERRDYELNVAQAEASVAQAQVGLDRELAESELAQREWQDLGLGDAAPLAARAPQLAEARARLAAAEANLEMAKLNLSRTTLRAPFDGEVRRKRVDLGQFVAPGTAVAEIFSTRDAEVALPIPQGDLAFLDLDWTHSTPGPRVELRGTVAGGEHTWRGQVARASSEIDPKTRMATLYVRVADRMSAGAMNGGARRSLPLPMGAFLEAAIEGRVVEGIAVLPRAVLREGDRVLIIDAESRLRFRPVEVLRLQDEDALISGGLAAGDLVCVSAIEAPVDGMLVRTLPVAAESSEREALL